MNSKTFKRIARVAAILTVPVATAGVVGPATAAVGDYTTKTYISWDYKVAEDGNDGEFHLNGKLPVDATKNGDAATPPSEVGGYYKNDDLKAGYTQELEKNETTLSGSLYGDDKSAINGSITTSDTDGDLVKGEASYTTPKDADGNSQQVGVKQNFDDPDTTKNESSTTLYAEERNSEGDKLGVDYNVTNGEVGVYVTSVDPIIKTDNATANEVTEYRYVVADTNSKV